MKLCITGAQSTGKTTLLEHLKLQDEFLDFTFLQEITRKLQRAGYVINEQADDTTQLLISKAHLENSEVEGCCILDRCTLDVAVYTHYLYNKGQVNRETLDVALDIFLKTIQNYTAIFYIKPEFAIKDDNVRSTSLEFRDSIVELFDYYIQKYNLNVYTLTGSIEERTQQFIEIYKELKCNKS